MKNLEQLKSLLLIQNLLQVAPRSKSELIKLLQREELVVSSSSEDAVGKKVQRFIRTLKSEGAEIEIRKLDGEMSYNLLNRDFSLIDKVLVDTDDILSPMIGARFASMIMPEPMKSIIETSILKSLGGKSALEMDTAMVDTILFEATTKVTINEEVFKDCFESWLKHKIISFSYPNRKGALERRSVEPYLLVYENQAWYLKGIDCHKDEVRSFAVHRITETKISKSAFPVEHDKLNKMLKDTQKFPSVKVKCSSKIARYVLEQEKARNQSVTQHADGSVSFTITNMSEYSIIKWVLSEGGNAWVIEPLELRDKVRKAALAALAVHSD